MTNSVLMKRIAISSLTTAYDYLSCQKREYSLADGYIVNLIHMTRTIKKETKYGIVNFKKIIFYTDCMNSSVISLRKITLF